jgi:hypothetical protein
MMKNEFDSQGRLKRINDDRELEVRDDFGRLWAHSVCNECGKDMPKCWDTVCIGCNRTFCYVHSHSVNGFWWCCKDCLKMLGGKR